MDIYTDAIRDLPTAEKLRLVEQLWDDIAKSKDELRLPRWALDEAARRRDEMVADPNFGLSHDAVWKRIEDSRHG